MQAILLSITEKLRYSYWYIPTLMALAAIELAFLTLQMDTRSWNYEFFSQIGLFYTGDASSAASLLSTLAGAMISIAGSTLSVALVIFTLASTQYGPRMLRNFMRDKGNQITLGTFVATFIYALIVLRFTSNNGENSAVPHLSISVAVGLALISLGVLIYFINHAPTSIRGVHIIHLVSQELQHSIEHLGYTGVGFEVTSPDEISNELDLLASFEATAGTVKASRSGYFQAVDMSGLMALATKHDLVIKLLNHPGTFFIQDTAIAKVWPGDKLDQHISAQINNSFVLGSQRTQTQDVEYSINQLVEMAIRALSPAVNDPFTAMMCLDRLGQGLSALFKKHSPSVYRYDAQQHLRLILNPALMEHLIKAAFNQIRQYGRTSVSVTVRMLEVITLLAQFGPSEEARLALLHQAEMLERGCHNGIPEESDRYAIHQRYIQAIQALGQTTEVRK